MQFARRFLGSGWLIALASAAAAVVVRAVLMPLRCDATRPTVTAGEVATARAEPVASDPPVVEIELPAPSIWPVMAGLGIALGFFGIVTSPYVGVVGVVVFLAAIGGWIGEMVGEHNG